MFARLSRSWSLVKASFEVLRLDKELLVFPFCSAIATIFVAASFIIPLITSGFFERVDSGQQSSAATIILFFLFYLVQYFVIFFFNTALVGAAMIRLGGGDPTVADGFRIAIAKLPVIAGYALIAATVGLILRAIEERAGWLGKWIAGLLGVAFTVATFLAVPVLVSRDVGPLQAVKESANLLKKTWGENLIGNVGIGLVFMLIYFALIVASVLAIIAAAATGSPIVIGFTAGLIALAVILVALIQSALQGVYSAALYRYATEATHGGNAGFDDRLLGEAFRLKA